MSEKTHRWSNEDFPAQVDYHETSTRSRQQSLRASHWFCRWAPHVTPPTLVVTEFLPSSVTPIAVVTRNSTSQSFSVQSFQRGSGSQNIHRDLNRMEPLPLCLSPLCRTHPPPPLFFACPPFAAPLPSLCLSPLCRSPLPFAPAPPLP